MTAPPCPVCDGNPRVLIAIRHPAMRRFTRDLLERDCRCWVATTLDAGELLAQALVRAPADLLVVDGIDFPACCRRALADFPSDRVIVIGPEPDAAYRHLALAAGAAAWIPRERIGEELGAAMRRALGCLHDPCPPGETHLAGASHGQTQRRAAGSGTGQLAG